MDPTRRSAATRLPSAAPEESTASSRAESLILWRGRAQGGRRIHGRDPTLLLGTETTRERRAAVARRGVGAVVPCSAFDVVDAERGAEFRLDPVIGGAQTKTRILVAVRARLARSPDALLVVRRAFGHDAS